MLAAPAEVSLEHFLYPIWTQGATSGGDTQSGSPNVFMWNSNSAGNDVSNWQPVTDLTNTILAPGTGVLVYVFADDDYDGSSDAFPKTLEVSDEINEEEVTLELNQNSRGFTLAGNPFAAPISFSELEREGITDVVYVWDNASNTWKTYEAEGGTGDLVNGIIRPFQGFLVQTDDAGSLPSLTFTNSARTSGGQFFGKEPESNIQYIRFELAGQNRTSSTWLKFSQNGSIDAEVKGDVLKLPPMSAQSILLSTSKNDNIQYDINHLPSHQTLTIPVNISAASGMYRLKVTDYRISEGLNLTFVDEKNNSSVKVTEGFEYHLNVDEKDGEQAPFYFTTKSSVSTTTEKGSELPGMLQLYQNYPNPFNPQTIIGFNLPAQGYVKLDIYDISGKKIQALLNEQRSAGEHHILFDARHIPSGIYFYRLQAGGSVLTKKLMLIK